MQKCPGCGAYFSDFDKACPHCGRTAETVEPEAGTRPEIPPEISPESTGTGRDEDTVFTPPVRDIPYPMKWHNFLMVIMIIGPVLSIITGFQSILAPVNTLDLLFSIAGIGVAVFGLVVRNQLKNFKKGSPNRLLILYGVTAGLNMLSTYLVMKEYGNSNLFSTTDMNTSLIGEAIAGILIILLSRKYYKRREDLFVN